MSEIITLQVTDQVLEKARATALRTERSVEIVLVEWLEQAAAQDVENLLDQVHYLYTPFESDETARDLQKILDEYNAGNLNADKLRS